MLRLLTEAIPAPRYQPYSTVENTRKLDSPICLNGEKATRCKAPCITEYVDMKTGEIIPAITPEYMDMETGKIIPARVMKDDPEVWPTVRSSERMLQREFILESLREEVREFAEFVLQFRNQRRGVTPGVEQLVKWYAIFTDKQACHVRRYVKPLEEAGVIAGSSLLGPLFQIAGKSVSANKHCGEDFYASMRFMEMLIKKRAASRPEVIRKAAPSYEAIAQAVRRANLVGGKYIEALVRALSDAGFLRPQFDLH